MRATAEYWIGAALWAYLAPYLVGQGLAQVVSYIVFYPVFYVLLVADDELWLP